MELEKRFQTQGKRPQLKCAASLFAIASKLFNANKP